MLEEVSVLFPGQEMHSEWPGDIVSTAGECSTAVLALSKDPGVQMVVSFGVT